MGSINKFHVGACIYRYAGLHLHNDSQPRQRNLSFIGLRLKFSEFRVFHHVHTGEFHIHFCPQALRCEDLHYHRYLALHDRSLDSIVPFLLRRQLHSVLHRLLYCCNRATIRIEFNKQNCINMVWRQGESSRECHWVVWHTHRVIYQFFATSNCGERQ